MKFGPAVSNLIDRYYATIETSTAPVVIDPLNQGAHRATVIWLHGLGECPGAPAGKLFGGDPLSGIRRDLVPLLPDVKFIIPRAQVRYANVAGARVPAWYNIHSLNAFPEEEDEQGIQQSCDYVRFLVEAECQRGTPAERIAIAGFSQGASIALRCGCCEVGVQLLGVLSIAGWLPCTKRLFHAEGIALATGAFRGNPELPVMMWHSRHDDLVPARFGQLTADIIRTGGFSQTTFCLEDTPKSHGWDRPQMLRLGFWLRQRIDRAGEPVFATTGGLSVARLSNLGKPPPLAVESPAAGEGDVGSEAFAYQQSRSGVWEKVPLLSLHDARPRYRLSYRDDASIAAGENGRDSDCQRRAIRILHAAASLGDVDTVRQILEEGVDIDSFDEDGRTMLHHAVETANEQLIAELWRWGADPNVADDVEGDTPAFIAVSRLHPKLVSAFVTTFDVEPTEELYIEAKEKGHRDAAMRFLFVANFPCLRHTRWRVTDMHGIPTITGVMLFYTIYVGAHVLGLAVYRRYPQWQLLDPALIYAYLAIVLVLHACCWFSEPGRATTCAPAN
eukprot:gene22374-26994_t